MIDILEKTEKAIIAEQNIRQTYRALFNTEAGRMVLEDMLWNLKFLAPCENEADMALCNYAKSLLAIIYGSEVIDGNRLLNLIRKLFKTRRIRKC